MAQFAVPSGTMAGHAPVRRQLLDALCRGTVSRPVRARGQGGFHGRRVPLPLCARSGRDRRSSRSERPERSALQHPAGRLGRGRARHGLHPGPRDRVSRQRATRRRLRARARRRQRPCARRSAAERHRARRGAPHLCREPPLRRRAIRADRRARADRADQRLRHAGLFPASQCRRAGDHRRSGCAESPAPVRSLSRPAQRRRARGDDRAAAAEDRPHADRRQPGRHEPGSGEINFPFLFAHIDRLGYAGHVGCEYRPLGTTEAGLGWLQAAQSLPAR